jgi:hypothetical protein
MLGVLGVYLSACFAARLRERASTELGCTGGIIDSSAKGGIEREHEDGTTYRFCCKNDHGRCAEYFCPASEKSGCSRL